MRKIVSLLLVLALPLWAGGLVYEANISHNGYRSAARALAIFDTTHNEMQISVSHELVDVRQIYIGLPGQNKTVHKLNGIMQPVFSQFTNLRFNKFFVIRFSKF